MRLKLRLVVTWFIILTMFTGLFPSALTVSFAASSSELIWPNPGALNLSKIAKPTGKQGEWEVTLTVEGKNIKTSSDVVLVIDRSGSMQDSKRMENARTAAKRYNLLIEDSTTRIGVVTFDKTAREISSLKGSKDKVSLIQDINGIINPSGGTNIQAGLHTASEMLADSQAENKVIVLLSDGEPTYSYKATSFLYSWYNNYVLTGFDYGELKGSGSSYKLSDRADSSRERPYRIGDFWDNYWVTDNGLPTLSEAKLAKDSGIDIYSVGLEVGKNENAKYVLNNVQNKGYYSSNSSELSKVFSELSGQISYAAQSAVVIDPMGEMFNLVDQDDIEWTASQGEVKWDAAAEKFNWEIGNIMEGSPATLTYKVAMDQKKNPDPNKLYPTNGKTTLTYTDINGKQRSKDFEVPEVSFGNGSITIKGYRVNADGKPVNAEGVVVGKPEYAEQLYSNPFLVNGSSALAVNKAYSIPAKDYAGYILTGNSPAEVKLTLDNPNPVVWFGYAKAPFNLKLVYKSGEAQLSEPEDIKKNEGDSVSYGIKEFEGYKFKDAQFSAESTLALENGQLTGSMPNLDVTVTFNYEPAEQQVTVKYLEKGTNKKLADPTSVEGVTGNEVKLKAADIPGYTVEKLDEQYTFTAKGNQTHTFYYTADEQTVTVKYVDKETNKEIAEAKTVAGQTDKEIELEAPPVPGYTADKETTDYTFTAKGDQTHTFYYTAAEQTVTVKYVDKATNQAIAEAKTIKGHTGEKIELKAPSLEGYIAEEATKQYTYTAQDDQTYTFYYNAGEQKVIVRYLDKETNKAVAEAEIVAGYTGKGIKLEAPPVPGYTAVEEAVNYTFSARNDQTLTFYYTADEQSVTVKYVDKATNQAIAEAKTVTGHTGAKIELEARSIEGYTAEKATEPYTFTAKNDQMHTFYYTADEQTVTIKYVDKDTNIAIAESTTEKGYAEEEIELKAATVTGYSADKEAVKYTFTAEKDQTYTFYYTANKKSVIVKYEDKTTGKQLAEPTTFEGTEGKEISIPAIQITGYTAEKTAENYTFTAQEDQAFTLYYTPDEQSVTVKYLDKETNEDVSDSISVTGYTDEAIELTAVPVKGYTAEIDKAGYTFTAEGNQAYTFYYTKDLPVIEQRTVAVHYVDSATGNHLQESSLITDDVGKEIALTADNITVGEAVYTPTLLNHSYVITSEENQQYTFSYNKSEPTPLTYDIVVSFMDQDTGAELSASTIVQGNAGSTISLNAITIEGYTAVKPAEDYLVTEQEGQQHTFYYTKNNPEQPPVTEPEQPGDGTETEVPEVTEPEQPGDGTETENPEVTEPGEQPGDGTETEVPEVTEPEQPGDGTETENPEVTEPEQPGDGTETENPEVTNPEQPGDGTETPESPATEPGDNEEVVTPLPPVPPTVTPLPPVPPTVTPLPPAPPALEMEEHFNYIMGYPDGTIQPEGLITREEVAAIFYRLMDDATRSDYLAGVSSYQDVSASRWSSKHIATMENAGIINGYPGGSFMPSRQITRAEFAAIASRFDELDEQENTMFSDIEGHWAEKYIVSAANKGWIKGYPNGEFRPDQYITRAEAMAFINSVLNRKVTAEGIHEDAKVWPDNSAEKWYYMDVLEATTFHEYSRNDDDTETWEQVLPDRVYP